MLFQSWTLTALSDGSLSSFPVPAILHRNVNVIHNDQKAEANPKISLNFVIFQLNLFSLLLSRGVDGTLR